MAVIGRQDSVTQHLGAFVVSNQPIRWAEAYIQPPLEIQNSYTPKLLQSMQLLGQSFFDYFPSVC
jgi:hypothetical protein